MNREVKFRAWDTESKHMLEWEILCDPESDLLLKSALGAPGALFIPMQYVGLKDKNGKEMAEGDILHVPHTEGKTNADYFPRDYEVFWEKRYGAFGARCITTAETKKEATWLKGYEWAFFRKAYNVEISGNIYENPELIA